MLVCRISQQRGNTKGIGELMPEHFFGSTRTENKDGSFRQRFIQDFVACVKVCTQTRFCSSIGSCLLFVSLLTRQQFMLDLLGGLYEGIGSCV